MFKSASTLIENNKNRPVEKLTKQITLQSAHGRNE